jgi:hypothetical protein
MSLEDFETGKNIVSPYIRIVSESGNKYCINTESFRCCQEWLILGPEDLCIERFRNLRYSRLAKVQAVIGDYNTGSLGSNLGLNRDVSWRKAPLVVREIGSVPYRIMMQSLPKVYSALDRDYGVENRKDRGPAIIDIEKDIPF